MTELSEELRTGELACTCQVSVELREALEGTDRAQFLRSWDRYLAWHVPEPGGPLDRLAAELGLPDASTHRMPGTQV